MKQLSLNLVVLIVSLASVHALSVSTTPSGTAYIDDTIQVSVTPNLFLDNVRITLTRGSCSEILATVSGAPSVTNWTPSTMTCGTGDYTVLAQEYLLLPTLVLAQASTQIEIKLPPVTPVYDSNPTYYYTTSADTYPPGPGTQSAQTFATITTPEARVDDDEFTIALNLSGRKVSGGTFNLNYRIWDNTTSEVILEGSLVNPTDMTTQQEETTITIPTANTQHVLLFQFKSSGLFSAVQLKEYSLSITSE